MVECTALEMRHTRKGIQGSNPCLSATSYHNAGRKRGFSRGTAYQPWVCCDAVVFWGGRRAGVLPGLRLQIVMVTPTGIEPVFQP